MKKVSSAYIPPFQLTEGQPAPFASNGGLSYMSFDQDGDAGTAAAIEAALNQIAAGKGQTFRSSKTLLPDRSRLSGVLGFKTTQSAWNIFGRTI